MRGRSDYDAYISHGLPDTGAGGGRCLKAIPVNPSGPMMGEPRSESSRNRVHVLPDSPWREPAGLDAAYHARPRAP